MKPFSDLTGKEKLVEVLRWALMVPAAVLAVVALTYLARLTAPPALVMRPGLAPVTPSDFERFLFRALNILTGAVFVLVGARVAPRWRRAAAIGLALLWIGYAFARQIYFGAHGYKYYWEEFFMFAAAAVVAAACICLWPATKKPPPGESSEP